MRPSRVVGLILLVPLASSQHGQDSVTPETERAVTRADLERHVRYLASDELRGRAAGSPGSRLASSYIARELERAGIEAGAEGGSYFQEVPLVSTTFEAAPQLTITVEGEPARHLAYGTDFSVDLNGWVGSTGPLRALVVRTPEDLPAAPDEQLALVMQSSRARSFAWLEDRGWDDGEGFGLILRVRPTRSGRPRSIPAPLLERAWTIERGGVPVVTVTGAAARALWEGEGCSVALDPRVERRETPERNVVGILRGSGELAQQVLVLSAHFDHMGVLPGQDPDKTEEDVIRNGADDDASGCALLLELAQALGGRKAPARTVVFLFCTAEERGMWGTSYYADHPGLADGMKIVCNLNFEMLGMVDELAGGPGRPWLTGFERTTLGPQLQQRGLAIGADQRPELSLFTRSDNIVFVRQGIVGQTLSTGGDNPNYHKVSDEVETLDFDHMEACARLGLEAAALLASGEVTPAWNEGEPNLGRGR